MEELSLSDLRIPTGVSVLLNFIEYKFGKGVKMMAFLREAEVGDKINIKYQFCV